MPKYRVPRHEIRQPLDKPYRLIPLTQGKIAIVDAADFKWLSQWNWCVCFRNGGFYAVRRINGKITGMHTIIMQPPVDREVDHRNFNTLDNRRKNLRICTHAQNMGHQRMQRTNKSGFKGVSWHSGCKKWAACISVGNRTIHLGWYRGRMEAALVYDEAAIRYRKDYAHLNYPQFA